MSLSKILSNTDEDTQYTVYGWVRNQEKILKLTNVPVMISSICIMYYRKEEIFEIAAEHIKVSKNKRIITNTVSEGFAHCNVYGGIQISADNDNKKIYEWKLRMNKMTYCCGFGIASEIYLGRFAIEHWQYMYRQGGRILDHDEFTGYRENYGPTLKEGDIMKIELDLNRSQIKYLVNDQDLGIAYKDIIRGEDIKYRLCASVGLEETEVEIISFMERRQK